MSQTLKYFLNAADTVPHLHKTTRKWLFSVTLKTQFSELNDVKKFLNLSFCVYLEQYNFVLSIYSKFDKFLIKTYINIDVI
jgi:hypothetical protein